MYDPEYIVYVFCSKYYIIIMCDDDTGNGCCRVGTLGGVSRIVEELRSGDLQVSGYYVEDEVIDQTHVGTFWSATLKKIRENEYISQFNGSKEFPPGGPHPEFTVRRSSNKAVLSFFSDDGTVENSWILSAPVVLGQTTATYTDFHHGENAAIVSSVGTSSAEFCEGTTILRSRAM